MTIVNVEVLEKFQKKHAQSRNALDNWYAVASRASWKNLVEVQQTYPHADLVDAFIVFNISGNKYRMITRINFGAQLISIKEVFTHAEYSKGGFRNACNK